MTDKHNIVAHNGLTLTATRRLQWCSGHRVMNHESKCAHLHGHNYVGYFTAQAKPLTPTLDELGRVIDFSVLKKVIGDWIERYWDHGMVLFRDDITHLDHLHQHGQKFYAMDRNPTAENMAAYLGEVILPELFANHPIEIVAITIDETENCSATWVKPAV